MRKIISQRYSTELFSDGGPARKIAAAARAVMEPVEARQMMSASPTTVLNQQVSVISAKYETQALPNGGEAGSDPTVWVNPADSSQSTIIGADKLGGIGVYDLSGNTIQFISDGDYYKVDTRSGFSLSGKSTSLVAADRIDNNTLQIFAVNPTTRQLTNVTAGTISLSNGGAVAGVTMYQSADTGKTYAFVSSTSGVIEQFELSDNGKGLVAAKSVRTIKVGSAAEGMTADDETGSLYVSQDGVAIWKYGAEPTDGSVRTQIDNSDSGAVGADSESLALYKGASGSGYLIAARQNTNDYVVYDRQTGAYVTKFQISASAGTGVDDVSSSDGIAVTSANLGNGLTGGAFIAEDDKNLGSTQNYKYISWADIANAQAVPLSIDGSQSSSTPVVTAPSTGSSSTTGSSSATLAVNSLSLYEANSDNKLTAITDGSVIDLADYQDTALNIRAATTGTTGSVKFDLNGVSNYHTENYSSFDLAGTEGVWTPTLGSNTLTATAYSDHKAKGTASSDYSVTFSVIDSSIDTGSGSPTATTAPATVKSLTATANASSQITVQWKAADNLADGYKVERSTDGGVTFKQVATTTGTSYVDKSVTAGTVYTYQVTAYNAIGSARTSSQVTATITTSNTGVPDDGSFIAGDRPSATSTGVKSGTKLTTVTNFKAVSNTTYTNLLIKGQVTLTGLSNVTLFNCVIDGGGTAKYGVRCDNCSGVMIKNCEIVNTVSCAIYGDGFSAISNFIHQSAGDGVKPNFDALIEGNYITQLGWYSPGAHADGVQIRGGSNITIRGNFFDEAMDVANTKCNSALFLQLDATGVTFDSNWVLGGNFAIHAFSDAIGGNATIKVTNNLYYNNSAQYGFAQVGAGVVWTGNLTSSGSAALPSTK